MVYYESTLPVKVPGPEATYGYMNCYVTSSVLDCDLVSTLQKPESSNNYCFHNVNVKLCRLVTTVGFEIFLSEFQIAPP